MQRPPTRADADTDALYCLFDTAVGACGLVWGAQGIRGVLLPEANVCRREVRHHLAQLIVVDVHRYLAAHPCGGTRAPNPHACRLRRRYEGERIRTQILRTPRQNVERLAMINWRQRVGALFHHYRPGGVASAGAAVASVPPSLPMSSFSPSTFSASAFVGGSGFAMSSTMPGIEAPGLDLPSLRWSLLQPFVCWLLGVDSVVQGPPHAGERLLLAYLDATLANDRQRESLLPRAPGVLTELIKNRRDSDELRSAIARATFKPMYGGGDGVLVARAGARLWRHAEATAALCRQAAIERGVDGFEGYVAGLTHNFGWLALLRAIDRWPDGAATRFSGGFVDLLGLRLENVVALYLLRGQFGDALTTLGIELLDPELAAASSPLGDALRSADERATFRMLREAGDIDDDDGVVDEEDENSEGSALRFRRSRGT